MNKKLGKTLAAVLSAAMAVSAFAMSTSASFAASNSVTFASATQYVALTTATGTEGAGSYTLPQTFTGDLVINGQTFEGARIDLDQKSKWQASRTDLVNVNDDGVVTIKNDKISQVQKVTFTHKATATLDGVEVSEHGKTENYEGTNVTVTVEAYIYPDGAFMVLPKKAVEAYDKEADEVNDLPESNVTISINDEADFDVYQVSTEDGTAKFNVLDDSECAFASSNGDFEIGSTGQIAPQDPDDVKTGRTTISAASTMDEDAKITSATLTVENTYHAKDDTTIESVAEPGYATKSVTDDEYNVTNMDIKADPNVTVNVQGDATVGDITGGNDVVIAGATAGDITATNVHIGNDQSNNVDHLETTVGNVKATGSIIVDGTHDKNEDEQYSKTTAGDLSAPVVTVSATEEENGPEGAVETGDITVSDSLTLSAGENYSAVEVGKISGVEGLHEDCPYTADLNVTSGTFDLGDLTYFGSVNIGGSAKANVTAGEINTGLKSDGSEGCHAQSNSILAVADGSTLTADYIGVTDIGAGSGTIQVPANSFEITGSIDGDNTLVVENVKKGDVLYKTAKNMEAAFYVPGVTAVKASEPDNLNWYTYTADGIEFRGITMDQQKVEVGTSPVTLSLSKVPASADLPEGVTVEWTANKDSVTLTPSADGMSCTVAATGYTEQNINGSNDVIVTAQLYKDGEPYDEFGTQFASASSQVTLTNKAPETPANPFTVVVTNAEGEEIACAADGTTVVEVPQSMAFNFSISSADTVENFDYTVGNDHVGGTNTNTVWNGTEGSYQIYAAGAVDSETGVYVNGIRIFTLKVGARPFTSDTTLDVDLNVGQKYQFEITLDDPTAPFTFLTADGQAVSTSYNPDTYPAENGKYYCSVTAQQAGRDIGVYCEINGKTYKIFTAHTIA